MAKLSDFYRSSTPEIFRKTPQPWERVKVVDCAAEFGAGTSTEYVRKLARRLGIKTLNIDGYAWLTVEDVAVMRDWHRHNAHKL
ncbi:hypothetical protein ACFSWE_14970 [Leucobacter albus]|uniref:Uncharacterized protein n=1 Tax=Leucobacter albus TaxID=272210 RepID=A0ABW3TNJ2_9MICO